MLNILFDTIRVWVRYMRQPEEVMDQDYRHFVGDKLSEETVAILKHFFDTFLFYSFGIATVCQISIQLFSF